MTIAIDAATADGLRTRHPDVFRRPLHKRMTPLLVLAAVAGYVVYAVWFFSIGQIVADGRWDRAGAYLADWVSWDVRPNIRFKDGGSEVTWPRFSPLGENPDPDWIRRIDAATLVVAIEDATVSVTPTLVTAEKDGETARIDLSSGTPRLALPAPSFAVQREDDVKLDFGFSGGAEVKQNRVAVTRRFLGWANFLFDPASPYFGRSAGDVVSTILFGDRIDPERSNLALAADNVWNNADWQHGDVFAKLLQTIVMAFAGTLLAVVVAFPLAFLAARNITPSRIANVLAKRYFDFQRTVDGLIWALFFIRAFGPGPIPGIAAIFFTDVGSLGKLYAEALENVDDRQREGIRSVGASPLQVQRYGVLPQVLPIFLSQALYHLESNTRSATIIGAVGAGGIGLKLLEAMRTNQDWENVCYMVLLILVVVSLIDSLSGALRRRLIGAA